MLATDINLSHHNFLQEIYKLDMDSHVANGMWQKQVSLKLNISAPICIH